MIFFFLLFSTIFLNRAGSINGPSHAVAPGAPVSGYGDTGMSRPVLTDLMRLYFSSATVARTADALFVCDRRVILNDFRHRLRLSDPVSYPKSDSANGLTGSARSRQQHWFKSLEKRIKAYLTDSWQQEIFSRI